MDNPNYVVTLNKMSDAPKIFSPFFEILQIIQQCLHCKDAFTSMINN